MGFFRAVDSRMLAEGALKMLSDCEVQPPRTREKVVPLTGNQYLRRLTARNLALSVSRGYPGHQLYLLPGIMSPSEFLRRQSEELRKKQAKKRNQKNINRNPEGEDHE